MLSALCGYSSEEIILIFGRDWLDNVLLGLVRATSTSHLLKMPMESTFSSWHPLTQLNQPRHGDNNSSL